MLKEEFERIAGYAVSDKDYYKIIEPMYIACELDKTDFIQTLNKKRFALPSKKTLINKMNAIAKHLYETCTHYTDYDKKDELNQLAEIYRDKIRAKNFYISDECKQSCYYPVTIVFYDTDYVTIEKIKFNFL